jgi:transposase
MTRNAQSAERQNYVRGLLSQQPCPTGSSIVAQVKKKFGTGIGTDTIWMLRKELGLTKSSKKKPGPKPGKKRASQELVEMLRGGQEPDSVKAALAVLQVLIPLPAETQRRVIMGVQVLLGQV